MDGEVNFRSAGEVLDIAITSVLGAALVDMSVYALVLLYIIMPHWDCSSTLVGDLALHLIGSTASMRILGIRWLSDNSISNSIGCNQLSLSTIPFSQDFGRWSTPQDSRVD